VSKRLRPGLPVDGIDQGWAQQLAGSPLNNRALQGVYPPGSTFKPFMAIAALELKKRSPHYTIADPGYFSLGGTHRWRDWKFGGHGMVDLHKSVVVSCDTYYYGVAHDLGIDSIHQFVGQFGFGKRTGIDIDGEAGGLLPSQEWKMRRFKQKWFPGDTISVGIGQGYNLATPIQLAHATSVLANGGVIFRPHIVRQIQNSVTNALTSIEVEPVGKIALNPANLERVTNAMVDVMAARRHRCLGRFRRAVPHRRQDRDGAGDRAEAARALRRAARGRASPRSRAVHRVRARRCPLHRARRAGGERRARRLHRRADRAQGVRFLSTGQGAAGRAGAAIARGRRMINRLLVYLGRHVDSYLLAAIGALLVVGLITLYSASGESFARLGNQMINIIVALALMWLAANIPPHYLQRLAMPVYAVGLLLLVAVALFGEITNGARRWLDLGITRIQPSELMKIAVPMALAWYFDRYEAILKLRDYLIAAVMMAVPVLLVVKQPDRAPRC
jgi:hypothetical protein